MFSSLYQSGLHIELLNVQNKDLVKNWKFTGKILKEYDSAVKGYVNVLKGGGVTRMTLPKDDKTSLGVVQSHIVFQIYLFSAKSLSIEITITDTTKVIK